jgi:hypothetical protein
MTDLEQLESYIWKGEKKKVGGEVFQDATRLIDATEQQLNDWYQHCKLMLYNDTKDHPGRYLLLTIIEDQINRCGVELFLRSLEQKGLTRFTFMSTIREFLTVNAEVYKNIKEEYQKEKLGPITIEFVASGVQDEFKKLPLDLVIDGCLDRLGRMDKEHITLTFILKQGLWFTSAESKDLTEFDINGKVRNKIDVVKERLRLRPETNIIITPKGLTYNQLRAMINLTSKKYTELTTEQLHTLRNRVLFALEENIKLHISQWEKRIIQINQIAEHKGFKVEE